MRKWFVLSVMCLAGCASSASRDAVRSDYDAMWQRTFDAVSDCLTVDSASKGEAVLTGFVVLDGYRSRGTVNLVNEAGQYVPKVSATREAHTQYFTSAKQKVYDAWEPVGPDRKLKRQILRQINSQIGKPTEPKTASFPGETYEAVFAAALKALSKYFSRMECADATLGFISTERSGRRAGDQTSDVRAVALVTKTGEAPTVRVKVVAERLHKAWSLWGLGYDLEPRMDFLGTDGRLEREMVDAIQGALNAAKQPVAVPAPKPGT